MKSLVAMAAAVLVLGACHYEFAAVKPNDLPLEPGLAGRWIQAEAPADNQFRQQLVAAPSRQGGAFIELQVKADARWFFRAHRLAKDLPGLYQLEFLGASTGERPDKNPFTIASATIQDGKLVWRLVDADKIGAVENGDALRQRIRNGLRNNEDLFSPKNLFDPDR